MDEPEVEISQMKPITLEQMKYRIEELYLAGIFQTEYNNMRWMAYKWIPSLKCKVCKEKPVQIFEGNNTFVTIFECVDCYNKKHQIVEGKGS